MTISPKHLPAKTITLIAIIVILAFIIGLSINPIRNYLAKREVQAVNEILNSQNDVKTLEQCRVILDFDKAKVKKDNQFFNEVIFDKIRSQCDKDFSFANVELNEENCSFIIREPKSYFKRNYIFLDKEVCDENADFDSEADGLKFKCEKKYSFGLVEERKIECSKKYLNPTFSAGTLFNIDNDFKSSIIVEFNLPFFRDIGEENSDEWLENRGEAKERLAKLIEISPYDYEINYEEDIYLYPERAVLNLNLEPKTEYTITLKSFPTDIGEQTKKQIFKFTTPENKYFGMKVSDPLTLYTKDNLPTFQVIDYNTEKMKTMIQVCPISVEDYAKVEVYLKTTNKEEASKFFKTGILTCNKESGNLNDSETGSEGQNSVNCDLVKGPAPKENQIQLNNCISKDLIYKDSLDINKNEFKGISIRLKDIVKDENPNGLYLVRLPEDVEYNGRINKPILFGVVNSHITMKVGRNGETFFFVNDLDGNPLENQEISVYLNDFEEFSRQGNDTNGDYDVNSKLNGQINVLSGAIVVGKTGKDGVLQTNLKDKVSDYFYRTFEDEWGFNWNGLYKSFFITSQDETYKSYLASTWNAGIAPWNFGYTTDWTNDENQIQLTQWGDTTPYSAHIYTDRVLYLPGEEVNIKTIIRDKENLAIPENVEFTLKVNNAKGEEILNKKFTTNEYGSYADTLALRDDFPLGNYSINLMLGDNYIAWGGFNVEVFKNPKFQINIGIGASGINGELVNISETETEIDNWGYFQETYKGNFTINGVVDAKYYNGGMIKNTDFTYKVYKQYYYDDNYWDNCYYGCYWEPSKEFYTEGTGSLDENGFGKFEIPVEFSSNYSDYKYIVEVTITDDAGDTITGSNSIVARLPAEYKRYNNSLDVYFESVSKFAKVGEKVKVSGGLNVGDWTKDYNDKFIFVIKRKEYLNTIVEDVNGYERNITKVNEIVDKVMFVNYDNFKLNGQGKLELNYTLDKNAEYVFEYGAVNKFVVAGYLGLLSKDVLYEWDFERLPEDEKQKISDNIDRNVEKIIKEFDKTKSLFLENEVDVKVNCSNCPFGLWENCVRDYGCPPETPKEGDNIDYSKFEIEQTITKKLNLNNLIGNKEYFTIVTYDNSTASNPIENDNKLRVISEKVSYNIGEKARVMVRLPYSNTKILWTIEKNGVVEHEYIDVPGNVFFKEFVVDDSFVPNAYIGVETIYPISNSLKIIDLFDSGPNDDIHPKLPIPQYKVGYTEIVVDKTDKKSFIDIKADKEIYKPREEISLNLQVKDKNGKAVQSELTVMVVDDSLISLMGNVDLNTLEKIFIKLPFSVQTSITNIAMLKNYYFSRIGIVGGSGDGNLKGGDSAVSTRNIFKNTAYFNPSVITDKNGKAQVKFNLPDNLTNFRVMVVSNSKDNHFGYSEKFIQVRKNVVAEDKTPLILRNGDRATIGANIFYNGQSGVDTAGQSIDFKVRLDTHETSFFESCSSCIPEQIVTLKSGESKFVFWDKIIPLSGIDEIKYTISVIGNNAENSDKIENTITIAEDPILVRNLIKKGIVEPHPTSPYQGEEQTLPLNKGEQEGVSNLTLSIIIPENTDLKNSIIELIFSNSRLAGIEKILKNLIEYPYGCIEQTVSSTLPNVVAKELAEDLGRKIPEDTLKEMKKKLSSENSSDSSSDIISKYIDYGVNRILSMQNSDGGFVYWKGNSTSDLHITPYVLRSLVYMKNASVGGIVGDDILNEAIAKATKYLKENVKDADNTTKAEIYWTLASLGEKLAVYDVKDGEVYNLPNISADTTLITLDVSKLNRHDLIAYTYGKISEDKNQKISEDKGRNNRIVEIRNLIEKIKGKLITKENNDYWYRDNLSDKAIFASLLLDFNDKNDEAYIEELVNDLYSYDWSSYWYSTQSKNNAFMAFHKYLAKTGANNIGKINISLSKKGSNKISSISEILGGTDSNIKKYEIPLVASTNENGATKVFSDLGLRVGDELVLDIENTGDNKVYVDYIIHQYPEDKTKVEPYSNGMAIKREIYEVLDESLLTKCNEEDYNDYYLVKVIDENKPKLNCEGALKLKTDNVFEKGKLYKTKVIVEFDEVKDRRNLTIEDYLPGSFRVINSRFKTESSALDNDMAYIFGYVEYRPDIVMANASYVWSGSKEVSFEYYFRAEFGGSYLQPPIVGYLMYEPEIRASGGYREVEVVD